MNYVITKNSTKEERLAAIKAVADKFAIVKARRARLAASAARVRGYVDEVEAPRRKDEADLFDLTVAKMDDNHNHYQDNPKYLNDQYGDRVRDQNAYESVEGWN